MRIWNVVISTTNAIKGTVPIVTTPVTGACRRSYDLGSSALAKVDNAVRLHGTPCSLYSLLYSSQNQKGGQKGGRGDFITEMGIWNVIISTTNAIKGTVPVVTTPVTGACRRSYDLGSSALAKVDNAWRLHGIQRLTDCFYDPQARQNIGCHLTTILTTIAKNMAIYGVQEGVKSVPGGSLVFRIVLQAVYENMTSEHKKRGEHVPEEIKVLQEENEKLREEIHNIKALVQPQKTEPANTSWLTFLQDEGTEGWDSHIL